MPFDAIIFDLGGVVVTHDNRVLVERIASRCRSGVSAREVGQLMRRKSWETGAPIAELHAELCAELGYSLPWDAFREDWCCHLAIDPAMLAFAQALAAENRVMWFSNTNAEHWDHLVAASDGALAAFEAHLSHELGLAKPSLASFQKVAQRAGIEPAQAIFFDDRPENVEGAWAAGFEAEVFESQEKLAALLRSRGVRF